MKLIAKRRSRKAFTLVELIVVLVILAVLAAMLVPALTGYIKKAKNEKDAQMAATYRVAAQAVLTEMYGRDEWVDIDHQGNRATNERATSHAWYKPYSKRIYDLVGDPSGHPYLLYIQCGRYLMYSDHNSSSYDSSKEAYGYTCYRIYYQASKSSGLIIIDDSGTYTVDSYNGIRDWVFDSSKNKIFTVVYALEHGPNSSPAVNLNDIERGIYGK